MQNIKLALIGKNISHSMSPSIYKKKLGNQIQYDLIDVDCEENLPKLDYLKKNYLGVSVTAPYKKSYCKEQGICLSDKVAELGILNTLSFESDSIFAHNTDYLAMKVLLRKYLGLINSNPKRVVLLGGGSMAACLIDILAEMKFPYDQYMRKEHGDISKLAFSGNPILLINCCSRDFHYLGNLPPNSIFWDLNYNTEVFRQENVIVYDGLEMLHLQADFALDLWKLT